MLIQGFSLNRVEKSQVIETFGDHYVYFFGERAPTASINMLLIDSETFEWFSQFDINYDTTYRGTQNALRRAPINIIVDGVQLVGYIQSVSYSQSASQDPYLVNVSLSMVLEKIYHLTDITKVKGLLPDGDDRSILNELSIVTDAFNTLTNRFKSVADEVAFLSSANIISAESALQIELQNIYNDYNKSKPTTYFDAYPNEYLLGKFGNVTATFDEISQDAEYVLANYEQDKANVIYSEDRINDLLNEYNIQTELINQNSENAGVYVDSVVPDQNIVDILSGEISDLFDIPANASNKLRAKQASSMSTSLILYGLNTLASNLTGAIDMAESALSGVRYYATNSVEGIFGPDRESNEDAANSDVSRFL
jgi:hypothetical protein